MNEIKAPQLTARCKVMNSWNSSWRPLGLPLGLPLPPTPPMLAPNGIPSVSIPPLFERPKDVPIVQLMPYPIPHEPNPQNAVNIAVITPKVDTEMSRSKKYKKCDKKVSINPSIKPTVKPNNFILKLKPLRKIKAFPPPLLHSNPYQNSFQQFLNQKKSETTTTTTATTNSSDNTFSRKKYIAKPKSETQIMAKKVVKKKVNQLRGIKTTKALKNGSKQVKTKRLKKPQVIKNLTESKSFIDFISKRFPTIKEGVPFIQDRSCNDFTKDFESLDLNFCLDCNDKRSNSKTCRFFQYRKLIKKGDQLSVYAFAEEGNATNDDTKIWLPLTPPKNFCQITARYLLTFVGNQFCKIYSEERQLNESFASLTWKKPVKGIRELCDVCETTIFNTHYVCSECGLAVCVDCYAIRESHPTYVSPHTSRNRNKDDFGWILCNQKKSHDFNAFHLAIFMTRAVFGSIDTTYHNIRNEKRIAGLCQCNRILPELNIDLREQLRNENVEALYPHVPRQWLSGDRLLVLLDPKFVDNIKLFQIHWLKGFPVVIQSVNSSLNYDLWTPEKFNLHFGRQMSRLVNCMNGFIIPKRAMSDFWDGFEDTDKRLTDDDTGEELILKLKDWPPNAEFRDMLPLWFDDLMQALPLPEYTRYDGSRNLASRLPEFYVRPDLGPKMYCAYGSVLHPDKGTTNLHLDMSDAVNVMIYVGVARKGNKPIESHINEANNTLLKGGCDEDMMSRANDTGHKVGALWHIWKAEDADKIRRFLNRVAKERNKRSDANADPIHDQSWYLDETLRTRLEQEYGVKGLAIAQCLGDSILVPAGAPHQVQNIHSCIKVAGEFVSPENVAHCLAMTQQFRNLSKRHNNHEDKLQIKNMIFHTVKDCLSVLVERDSKLFPMPSPPKLVSESISTSIPDNTLFESKSSSDPLKEEEMDTTTTETESSIKTLPLKEEKRADDKQMPFISHNSNSETVPIPSEESPSEESHAIESDAIECNEKESNAMESDVKESHPIECNAIETKTDDKTSITTQMSSEQQNETEVENKESDSPILVSILAPPPSLSVVIEPLTCSSPDTLGSPPILMPFSETAYSDYNSKDCISKSWSQNSTQTQLEVKSVSID